jgi:hypothetical protein
VTGAHRFDELRAVLAWSPPPTVAGGSATVAWVSLGVEIGRSAAELLERTTPLPPHGSLVFVRHGKVVAGGPAGARYAVKGGEVTLGSGALRGPRSAARGGVCSAVFAIEPVAAIDARDGPPTGAGS